MRVETVTCDGCGADLTTRSNSVDYRLVLADESKPDCGSSFYTDMMIYPSLDRPHHFCGLACLDHWRAREKLRASFMSARADEWKDEHGTKDADGRVRSYPAPSREIHEAWEDEADAAALAAFPVNQDFKRR